MTPRDEIQPPRLPGRIRTDRRSVLRWGVTAGLLAGAAPALAACGGSGGDSDGKTTLRVVGFEVNPDEKGTPLDKAYKKFLSDFEAANPTIKIDSQQTPPEFDTKIIVDLASGTAPDLWSQDASSLAPLIERKLLLDMRQCLKKVPGLKLDRFFPSVLKIHEQHGGIYGLPNDFTPMVVYYNPSLFKARQVDEPKDGWTWDDLLAAAKTLTRDDSGRSADDSGFDAKNVKTWGYRASKYTYSWVFRVWQNGGDVLSPDRSTASGYLDSDATLEALQWHADMVLKHKVSPAPSALDAMTQKSSFDAEFVKDRFAIFDSGHWELVGLTTAEGFTPDKLGVVQQPRRKQSATVLYESSFVVRHDVEPEKLEAIAKFVDAATGPKYQDTKAVTGIAIAANRSAAEASLQDKSSQFADVDDVFIKAADLGRPPSGSQLAKYPTIEGMLDDMMDRIMRSGDVEKEVGTAIKAINRELESQ